MSQCSSHIRLRWSRNSFLGRGYKHLVPPGPNATHYHHYYMTDEEFEEFLSRAMQELNKKQESLKEQYGLGTCGRWWFDQTTETLQFFDEADDLVIEADVVEIGSYSSKSNTWKWGWGNTSLLPALRTKGEPLKELEDITGLKVFGQEHAFEIKDEGMAWELAAISIKHLGALGCYRAPTADGLNIFLAITNVWRIV